MDKLIITVKKYAKKDEELTKVHIGQGIGSHMDQETAAIIALSSGIAIGRSIGMDEKELFRRALEDFGEVEANNGNV